MESERARVFESDVSALLMQALEQSAHGVLLLDARNCILWLNSCAERLFGWPRDEVVGRDASRRFPGTRLLSGKTRVATHNVVQLAQSENLQEDLELVYEDGTRRWIRLTVSGASAHKPDARVLLLRDITEERHQAEQNQMMRHGLEETYNAVFMTDSEGRFTYINKGVTRVTGYSQEDILGKEAAPVLLAADYSQEIVTQACELLSAGKTLSAEHLIYDRRGKPLWCAINVNPVLDAHGALEGYVGEISDITRSKIHEVLQNHVLDALAREVPFADVLTLICTEVERFAPQTLASILKIDSDGRVQAVTAPSLSPDYRAALRGLSIGPNAGSCGTAAWCGETVVVSDIASSPLWEAHRDLALAHELRACWAAPLKSGSGQVIGAFALYYREPREPDAFHRRLVDLGAELCTLVLEREAAQASIHRLAFYDELTGLPNRSLLRLRADQAILDAAQTATSLAVLFIDLDRFKQINDSLGHSAGDQLIREIAMRLKDAVGASDIVGRLSGDEFIVILADCDAEQVVNRVGDIQGRLSTPFRLLGITLLPSASVGISVFPDNGKDVSTLLHHADMALSQAKLNGRARFHVYGDEMTQRAAERSALEAALRHALQRRELTLHYQPQISMADGCLHGVEALARWIDAQLGEIEPPMFIALSEECGLTGVLGRWALQEACQQLAAWRQSGLAIPSMSVNLSPSCFHDLELPKFIAEILLLYGLKPADLTIEITEKTVMDPHPSAMQVLGEVHRLGVRISLDDFGSGYSSLGYLHRLPVSELKLDKAFVQALDADTEAQALTMAVLGIGSSLGLSVVAEGVENDRQLARLREQGCHAAQGYHFSPAIPPGALAAWVYNNCTRPADWDRD